MIKAKLNPAKGIILKPDTGGAGVGDRIVGTAVGNDVGINVASGVAVGVNVPSGVDACNTASPLFWMKKERDNVTGFP